MPELSVLLPCYNAAATLDEALESLARQSIADMEILAVDDAFPHHPPGMRQIQSPPNNR